MFRFSLHPLDLFRSDKLSTRSLSKTKPEDAAAIAKLMLSNAALSVGNLDDIKELQDSIQSVVAICTSQHSSLHRE